MISSAPPKLNTKIQDNKLKPVHENPIRAIVVTCAAPAEKVHIPDTFNDLDAESETLSDKIRKLDGYGDVGQGSSKQYGEKDDHQIMIMKDSNTEATMNLMIQHQMQKQLKELDDSMKVSEVDDARLPSQENDDDLMEGLINS